MKPKKQTIIRKAFLLSVYPDKQQEYRERHDPIWPELAQTLKAHGVHNYSIFLHEPTGQLFGYAEIESEAQWAAIAETDICRRWWAFMKDLMPINPDNSPVSAELISVFFLE